MRRHAIALSLLLAPFSATAFAQCEDFCNKLGIAVVVDCGCPFPDAIASCVDFEGTGKIGSWVSYSPRFFGNTQPVTVFAIGSGAEAPIPIPTMLGVCDDLTTPFS